MALDILLVEDSQTDAMLAIEALVDSGLAHRVSIAEDGNEALDHLRKSGEGKPLSTPDIILLDLNMPRLDGHGVLKEIRSIDSYKDIPVVVLTVSQAEEDICRALELGMNFYLRKPVKPETLKALLAGIQTLWKT